MRNFRNLEHIIITSPSPSNYKEAAKPIKKNIPYRDHKVHAQKLKAQINSVKSEGSKVLTERKNSNDNQILLTIKGQKGHHLEVKSLESKKEKIEVVRLGISHENEQFAIVKASLSSIDFYTKKINEYEKNQSGNNKAPYEDVVNTIEAISLALIQDLWGEQFDYIPNENNEKQWWEVWIDGGTNDREIARYNKENFLEICKQKDIQIDEYNFLEFPDRQVVLIYTDGLALAEAITNTSAIVELNLPSKPIVEWHLNNRGINFNADENILAIKPPEDHFTTISMLDTGISSAHPYIEKAINKKGLLTIDKINSSLADIIGHGTAMTGVALYEELAQIVSNGDQYTLPAWIESVRIPLAGDDSQRELWGKVISDSVKLLEDTTGIKNRIFCMAIGAESKNELGKPSSWSAAIDQLVYNEGKSPRIFVLSAGNIQDRFVEHDTYPYLNLSSQLDDPAQARNAITVGAMTQLDTITESLPDYIPVAKKGQISPYSKSHIPKNDAIKPDIVCEGGNIAHDGTLPSSGLDGLCILTANNKFTDSLFTVFYATSAATANASRMLAQIWNSDVTYRPETVRGLLIHSASWTKQMREQFTDKRDLFRICGYGVPDVNFALRSAQSSVTLISESRLRVSYTEMIPGKRGLKKGPTKRDILVYDLPWPEDLLVSLGEEEVELRVTLSYFIQPNPKNTLSKYEGSGLKWDLKSENETDTEFLKRVNFAEREDGEGGFKSPDGWEIGIQRRSRGTIQSDRWNGLAVNLASRNKIAIFPSYGWWKDNPRKHPNPEINFSLIVTITSKDSSIELYNEVMNEIKLKNLNLI